MENNINRIEEANMVSNGYLSAARYLKMCVEKEYTLLGIYAPAYTANLALACELYFKQLLVIRKIDVTENGRKIHKLKNLYLTI